jgi:hypothetical protein
MHPYMMTLPLIEANLLVLYSVGDLDEETYERRAALAHAYYDRTGRWFAARFY